MIKIFGDNNWSYVPTHLTETIVLKTVDIYNSNPDETVLKLVKQKYEKKTNRNCFIKEVIEILEYTKWEAVSYSEDSYISHVVFKALIDNHKIGDLIIGAIAEKGGRSNDTIHLRKDYLALYATCNANIPQLLTGQKISLKIKTINWDQYADVVIATGIFTHSCIYPNKTFCLNSNEVKNLLPLIEEYKKAISKYKSVPKKESDMLYPFNKDQSDTYKNKKVFLDVLDDLIKKDNETIYIMKSCFLQKEQGLVYVIPEPKLLNEKDTQACIQEIFEDTIKANESILEIIKEYSEKSKYLDDFYHASKMNYDNQINNIKKTYIE